jgi:hypothetical protein
MCISSHAQSRKRKINVRFRGKGKKVKFALEQSMKVQRGSRGIALLFL